MKYENETSSVKVENNFHSYLLQLKRLLKWNVTKSKSRFLQTIFQTFFNVATLDKRHYAIAMASL